MAKFKQFLTETGDKLINKRADNLTEETKQEFEDQKRIVERKIRNIENDIVSMEDLSVRNTQTLVVGETLNTKEWVNKRINYALELRDLRVELETISALIKEYFEDKLKKFCFLKNYLYICKQKRCYALSNWSG